MRYKKGFPLVELMTAVTIIAMLIGILIPSLRMVRGAARDAKQRAQLTTIGIAISAFRNDYGDYPPSAWTNIGNNPVEWYGGIQKLTEALVGWDLMGFHPDSRWHYDGKDPFSSGGTYIYPYPLNQNDQTHIDNLKERRGPYLELATADVFKLEDLFANLSFPLSNATETYVLCDVYKTKKIDITSRGPDDSTIDTLKAGTPLLYYKANTSRKTIRNLTLATMKDNIYNANDNRHLVEQKKLSDSNLDHPLAGNGTANDNSHRNFYELEQDGGIADSKISIDGGWQWPVRPDSYILISAGADGLYGTEDDITNFK